MKVVENIDEFDRSWREPVATIGAFDGVHKGHRSVLSEVQRRSRSRGGTSVVVTFEPDPEMVLRPQAAPPLLTTREEKLEVMARLGIDVVLILPFTLKLADLSPREFVEEIFIRRIKARELVVGHDFSFGRDRVGGVSLLRTLGREFNFEVDTVPPVMVDGQRISSTRIRGLIAGGRMSEARVLLGYYYSLGGRVIYGDGRGRELGFPTANLELDHPRKLVPPDGVYAVWVINPGARRRGLLNIGRRPSFGGGERSIEVHIFGFSDDLYGNRIRIEVVERIREEMKFATGQDLGRQIETDKEMAYSVLTEEVEGGSD